MTRAEFARALRVDPTTVDAWRRDGALAAGDVVTMPKRPGARASYRYRRSAVARILGPAQ